MKTFIMTAVALLTVGFITACVSVPKHHNMTGTWKYTFEETGKSEVQNGSMTIAQESYAITGKCNDAFGEFNLTGSVSENSSKFMINGKRNDGKREFNLSGSLSCDKEFEGTYTTDQNTSGTMKGKRVIAD